MNNDLLKRYISEVLVEDVVTVTRGKEQSTYDMTFDKDDNIIKSKKIALDPAEMEVLNSVQKIAAAVPQGEMLKKLRDLKTAGVRLQAPAKNPQNVMKTMNKYWADTLDWPTVSRIGRGELQLRLAFKTNPDVPEPDFVSADGVSLSVKFLGNGSQTAKTGEASKDVPGLVAEFGRALGVTKFPQGSWSGENLINHLSQVDPRKKAKMIADAKKVLDSIKAAIVGEHDADGILMLDFNNGFYLVTRGNYQDVHPTSIRNSGTRIEFTGPKLSPGITTLERALNYAESGERPQRGRSKKPLPASED